MNTPGYIKSYAASATCDLVETNACVLLGKSGVPLAERAWAFSCPCSALALPSPVISCCFIPAPDCRRAAVGGFSAAIPEPSAPASIVALLPCGLCETCATLAGEGIEKVLLRCVPPAVSQKQRETATGTNFAQLANCQLHCNCQLPLAIPKPCPLPSAQTSSLTDYPAGRKLCAASPSCGNRRRCGSASPFFPPSQTGP
jgi:hypothetical protein